MKIRQFLEYFRFPRRCGVIMPSEEISIRYSVLHSSDKWIERTQAHGPLEPFNRHLRLAKPELDPAAPKRCKRQIRVERECSINEGGPGIKVAGHMHKYCSASSKCECIISA